MKKWAYYNDSDAFACDWTRELIKDGLIAPGEVDCRSITEVQPEDVRSFNQVHLFSGIGGWSAAARLAGWSDDRPFWSASCPCPPFSTAGKVKACGQCGGFKPIPHVSRTGYFLCSLCGNSWAADSRHLWPEVWRLLRDRRPSCVVGEQVASGDGRTWLDLVRASLEILAYDAWGVDTCAAGFGAPHIRQRLYWMADTDSPESELIAGQGARPGEASRARARDQFAGRGDAGWLADAEDIGVGGERGIVESTESHGIREIPGQGDRRPRTGAGGSDGRVANTASGRQSGERGTSIKGDVRHADLGHAIPLRLDDTERSRLEGFPGDGRDRNEPGRDRALATGPTASPSPSGGLANADGRIASEAGAIQRGGEQRLAPPDRGHVQAYDRPGPVNGLWRDVDWLRCTDGKWRAVEPGTFPLANAGAYLNRVAELRGAGNAINIAQAAGFLHAIGPEARQ